MAVLRRYLSLFLLFITLSTIHSFSVLFPSKTESSNAQLSRIKLAQSAISLNEHQQQQSSNTISAAEWHKTRRRQMIQRYGDQILLLEREISSQNVALPLLIMSNTLLLTLSILCGSLSLPFVILLSVFPGSILSLWQLQILHDVLHGSFYSKSTKRNKSLENATLFWGSMPSVFGYYLYLKFGHLSHHKNVGNVESASLETLFDSSNTEFEDGDVLFVAHRMKLKGDIGPSFRLFGKTFKMSISKSGFNAWRQGNAIWNSCMFASSFLFERCMLVVNDVVVSVTGRNFFFPNKPMAFHKDCARYARVATLIRAALLYTRGWKSLLFLFLSETLWSLPPHPASAMFVTNHGSSLGENGECIPTSSTYAGTWYSLLTLGTNYHTEHHDFPTIPLNKLGELQRIAPEFYTDSRQDNLLQIMYKAFANPDFYACMDAGIVARENDDSTAGDDSSNILDES